MGVYAGPEITSDGLVLALDAGNSKGFDDDENLLTYSNFSFSSITAYPTGWRSFNPGRVVRSIGQSPDGTDAAIVGKQFGNSGGFRPTSVTLSASTNYTVSFYARKPTDSELSLFLSYFPTNDFTTQPYTKGVKIRYDDVDTSTGSTGSTSFTLTDTWQRFTYTFNSGSDTAISPNFTSLTVADAYDSNGLFVISSVQVERGSSASPYYPTTGTAKNRGTTLIDMTGRGNSGTLTNGPTYSSANGGSIVFDGTNDYVNCGKTASQLGIYDADYTFDAWVYPTNLDSDKTMFGTDQTGTRQGLHLVFRNGAIYQGHFAQDFSAGSATLNAWNNISYTYVKSSGLASIYKNGVLQGSGTILSFIGTDNILIGRWASNYYFSGNGSNYKIYNRALTASEIQQNFIATRSRFSI